MKQYLLSVPSLLFGYWFLPQCPLRLRLAVFSAVCNNGLQPFGDVLRMALIYIIISVCCGGWLQQCRRAVATA